MIRIENISKNLGEFCLDDVSLKVNEGEYLMILGPTGAGKTILLETLAGIYPPDKGSIFLDGVEITRLPPRKRNIGMVYQNYMLFPHLNIEKNICYGLKSRKMSRKDMRTYISRLTDLLGISHLLHRYPGTLSGGEQQRAAIARALVMEPKVLLLDEPLSALDSETRSKLREELRRVHSITRTTMIHVTHSFNEAFLLGTRMAIMNRGKIVQIGEPGEVFRKPNCKFAAEFLGVSNIFPGHAVQQNGASHIDLDGFKIFPAASCDGNVYASIRPEDIIISLDPFESSARNSFSGQITEISDTGLLVNISVDAGIPLLVTVTKKSFVELGLRPGMTVYLTFKATDVHVFENLS
ncbi:MAG: tungstate ABC transporter ATP-binding protein WtpC [Dehalococcoidales bacterium]